MRGENGYDPADDVEDTGEEKASFSTKSVDIYFNLERFKPKNKIDVQNFHVDYNVVPFIEKR